MIDMIDEVDEQKLTTPQRIKTFNVTRDPYDNCWIIVCPKCGDYVYYARNTESKPCSCGYYWTIKTGAIGRMS